MEIWTKSTIKALTVLELATKNYVTVRIDDEIYITAIYDEPGGNTNKRLIELDSKLGNNRERKHVLGGDLNALSGAWGLDDTDKKGEELLE